MNTNKCVQSNPIQALPLKGMVENSYCAINVTSRSTPVRIWIARLLFSPSPLAGITTFWWRLTIFSNAGQIGMSGSSQRLTCSKQSVIRMEHGICKTGTPVRPSLKWSRSVNPAAGTPCELYVSSIGCMEIKPAS